VSTWKNRRCYEGDGDRNSGQLKEYNKKIETLGAVGFNVRYPFPHNTNTLKFYLYCGNGFTVVRVRCL
jgi:hypothetical protein